MSRRPGSRSSRCSPTRPGVRLPTTLDGVRVQTVVTGMIVARSATLRYPRPVPIGVSTGLADAATGTLGARVTNGANVYALSNNHVFAGVNAASIGDHILQPGPIEDGGIDPADLIATLADYQADRLLGGPNTMDAAIALTTTGDVGTATLPDGYGSPSSTTVPASVGMQVQKYGRTTGFTTGSINAVNVDVDVCYFPLTETICFPGYQAHFVNQFSIPDGSVPFSASGDSGSLVVTTGSNNPVGLLFAGGDGLTIANPIDAVLQRFGVTIDGAAPRTGPRRAHRSDRVAGDGRSRSPGRRPRFDGGSPITGYKVYRGTSSAGGEAFLQSVGTSTSYIDTRLHERHDLLLQGVGRERRTAKEPLSNEACCDPRDLVPPAMPLPIVDNFNRAEREPALRRPDAGRTGSSARARPVCTSPSNWLACSMSTTCTAWRNNCPVRPRRRVVGAHRDAARREQRAPAATRASSSPAPGLRRLHAANEPARRAPTRSSSSGSTTAPSSPGSRSTRSSRPATPCSCARRARPSRPGATTARLVTAWRSSATPPTPRSAPPASACAGRPAASTTSVRGASA